MRTVPVGVPLAALLVVALSTASCGADEAPGPPPAPVASQPAPPVFPLAGTASQPGGAFSPTDIAWLQLAIALNGRAVEVLDVVVERTDDPAVRRLAGQLATGHRAELGELDTLLRRSGGPATNPHEGHDMPGMATAADLAALRVAGGAELTRRFTDALRRHCEQSLLVARGEQSAGAEPATRQLAAKIERSRTDQLGRINRLAPGPVA